MNFRSAFLLACCSSVLIAAQPAFAAPAPATGFFIDARTPEGLRELFKAGGERLPVISAHRGGAGPGYPENCLATFQATVAHGWSMLEMDLHASKDGVVVLMHDATLDRTSSGKGLIKDRTFAELQDLRLKDRQGNLTEHRIPTLDEVFQWARGKAIMMLDKKETPVKEVVRLVTEHKAEAYAMVMAYNINEVKECHALNPQIMMEVMMGTREKFEEFDRSGVPWTNVIAFVGHTATPDAELCRRIREKGARCMAGTSRNIDREFLTGRVTMIEPLRQKYLAVFEQGIDVLETDIPRDVAPLLYAGQRPAGEKAKFLPGGAIKAER